MSAGNLACPTPIWHPSAPDRIETDLAAVWRDLARGGSVSRAVMSNLVVVTECPVSAADFGTFCAQTGLAEVAKRHPARTILLGYTPGVPELTGPRSASVAVLTFGEGEARYGVELVGVHAACGDQSVASIVRSLVLGDLPTSVWWTSDLAGAKRPAAAIAPAARQFIYDSTRWHDIADGVNTILSLLADSPFIDIADLAWRRLATLRRAIVQAARSETIRAGDSVDVLVRHRPGDRALAALLIGWLRSRFESKSETGFRSIASQVTDPLDHAVIVTFSSGHWHLSATMDEDCVEVQTTSAAPPFSMPVASESEPEAIASELRSISRDQLLRDALQALAQRS